MSNQKGQWRLRDNEIILNHKPVATIACGEIGDKFPTIRLVEGTLGGVLGRITLQAEMDIVAMDSIPEEEAAERGEFIVRACNSYADLLEACKEAAAELHQLAWDFKIHGQGTLAKQTKEHADKAEAAISKAVKP